MLESLQAILESLNPISTAVRLILSLLLGGILGFERGRKRRPAGLRTYMIVCMASALVMLTGQYTMERYGTGDPARLGAQVISGIGFLGAGTIIITSRQVKGLTTAAGLWAAACMGLAVGAGFYLGGILCGILLLIVMTAMSHLDNSLRNRSKYIAFFAEFRSMESLGYFNAMLRANGYKLNDIEISKATDSCSGLVGATFWVETNGKMDHMEAIQKFSCFKGVQYLEELSCI